jgi:hypothetical protein
MMTLSFADPLMNDPAPEEPVPASDPARSGGPHPSGPALLDPPLASELTLGLLHNANNAMTGLYFTIESCLEETSLPAEIREHLEEALHGLRAAQAIADRAAEIHLGLRETSYHEAGDLLRRQLDLLKIILPKGTAIEQMPATELLHLQIDEAGFRRILLSLVRWLRPALQRPPRLVLGARAGLLASGQPAVVFCIEAVAETDGNAPENTEASEYGADIAVHRLPAPRGVEVTLALPRVELEGSR